MSRASHLAYSEIRNRLLAGEFLPGERLSESDLSEKCGVSRTPVREALRRLALEYFVRIEPNRGAFVIDWSCEDVMDMFEMRSMMEGLAARKAAERADERHLSQMTDLIDKIDAIATENSAAMWEDFIKLNREFHDTVFEASGSRKLTEIIARFVEQAIVMRTASKFTPDDVRRSNQHHKDLLQAIKGRNGVLAESIMRVHILAAASRYNDGYIFKNEN